ncbi:hypothetical protein H6P81_017446 [Aristolochia fimbriata]|uniref:Uncharacterized protein n=1 Tax=Aristolochia fimbriata TaxID=158543 RepID=A0AAV7DYC7_ARIFI|nr:hypothetical protein H6P81_017446 [Aristolochia fimbriata]
MEGHRAGKIIMVALVFGLLLVLGAAARPVPEDSTTDDGYFDLRRISSKVWSSYATMMETRDTLILRSSGGGGNPAPQGNEHGRGH